MGSIVTLFEVDVIWVIWVSKFQIEYENQSFYNSVTNFNVGT